MARQIVPRGNYDDLTPEEIEQVIHRLEEERVAYDQQFREEKARAHEVLDRKNAEQRTARLTAHLSEDQKAALIHHLGVPGIESTAQVGPKPLWPRGGA